MWFRRGKKEKKKEEVETPEDWENYLDGDQSKKGKMSVLQEISGKDVIPTPKADTRQELLRQGAQLDETIKSALLAALKRISIGAELSELAPAFILEPVSFLELTANFIGDPVLFASLSNPKTQEERMIQMVRWYMSTHHCKVVYKKPYNPILGEEFRCSWSEGPNTDTIWYHGEQVSHHPPVSAFYFESTDRRVIYNGHNHGKGRFLGHCIKISQEGTGTIELPEYGEKYILTFPTVYIRGILSGRLIWELGSTASIKCLESGICAQLHFKQKPFFYGEFGLMKGKIYHTQQPDKFDDKDAFAEIKGNWMDRTMIVYKNPVQGVYEESLWNGTNAQVAPRKIAPLEEHAANSSTKIWRKVTEALQLRDWPTAEVEKRSVEVWQRKLRAEREKKEITWSPKYFHLDGENWIYNNYNNGIAYGMNWKEVKTEEQLDIEPETA